MDPVSVLVFNALAKRQGINLPGVGALHVVTSAARTEERNTLVPPVNRVELLPDAQPGFLDVIDRLARYGETDRDDAQQTYNSWLAQVSSEEGVTIDSVGLVSEGTFRPAPQMAVVLNPAGTAPMRLPRKGSGNGLLWWVVLAVVVGAGISVGAIAWLESRDAPIRPGRSGRRPRPPRPAMQPRTICRRLRLHCPGQRLTRLPEMSCRPRSLRPLFPAFRPPDKSATT